MKTSLKLLALVAALATAGSSQAAPVVYEDFQGTNYAAGNTIIGVTAQGEGLTGTWAKDSATSADSNWLISNSSSMSYTSGDVTVNGGTKYFAGDFSSTTAAAANIQLKDTLTPAGGAIYISFLMRYSGNLHNGDQLVLQVANTNSITSIMKAGVRGDGTDQDLAAVSNNSSTSYIASPLLTAGTTYLAVVKLDVSGSNWNNATMYLNPTSTTIEGGAGSIVRAITSPTSINWLGMRLQNGDAGDVLNIDEIRIGATWSAVVIPEPSTWLLIALTGTFFMITRRRKMNG